MYTYFSCDTQTPFSTASQYLNSTCSLKLGLVSGSYVFAFGEQEGHLASFLGPVGFDKVPSLYKMACNVSGRWPNLMSVLLHASYTIPYAYTYHCCVNIMPRHSGCTLLINQLHVVLAHFIKVLDSWVGVILAREYLFFVKRLVVGKIVLGRIVSAEA